MRNFLLFVGLFLSLQTFASWLPFGPEGIKANKIVFSASTIICHDEGIYLFDYENDTWINYESNLPVLDAHYLNDTIILLIIGGGSNSDGIYHFNTENEQFSLIQFRDFPNFLVYNYNQQKYYVGYRLGIVESTDGFNWTDIEFFENKNIVSMDIYLDNFVVSEMDNLYGIFISNDAGFSWTQPESSNMYSSLKFDKNGKLYGVFPDESWSSGLYSSTDYGQTWEIEFWSININSIGFDAINNVFVGWKENPHSFEEGIAYFDENNDTLISINNGLANLIINDICLNPILSSITLFCATDSGCYSNYNPTVVNKENYINEIEFLSIFPNPASELVMINYKLPETDNKGELKIYNQLGQIIEIMQLKSVKGEIKIDLDKVSSGIYYVNIKSAGYTSSQKLIVRN